MAELAQPFRHGRSDHRLIFDNQYPRHASSIDPAWCERMSSTSAGPAGHHLITCAWVHQVINEGGRWRLLVIDRAGSPPHQRERRTGPLYICCRSQRPAQVRKIGVGTTTGLALGFSSVARGVPLSSTRCRRGAIGERLKRLPMRIAQDEHTAGALIESGLLLGIACPVCRHRALFDLQRIAPHPRPVWQLPF